MAKRTTSVSRGYQRALVKSPPISCSLRPALGVGLLPYLAGVLNQHFNLRGYQEGVMMFSKGCEPSHSRVHGVRDPSSILRTCEDRRKHNSQITFGLHKEATACTPASHPPHAHTTMQSPKLKLYKNSVYSKTKQWYLERQLRHLSASLQAQRPEHLHKRTSPG